MDETVIAGIYVGVTLFVLAIIAIVFVYRKRSKNTQSVERNHLKRKRGSDTFDYILLDKNVIDRITINHHSQDYRPLKHMKMCKDKDKYYTLTDKPMYYGVQREGVPIAVSKHKTNSRYKPIFGKRYDHNEYFPFQESGYGKPNHNTVEVGDGHRIIKYTCTDGKYKNCGDGRTGLRRKSVYDDLEDSSNFTKPIKKHLAKIRPVRRPSLHNRKQEHEIEESDQSLQTDLFARDIKTKSNVHTSMEIQPKTSRRSVKEIVDDVKKSANLKSEKPAKTVVLTNEEFGKVGALRENYVKKCDNQESAMHNLNTSGKERRKIQGINVNEIDQNKSDISPGRFQERTVGRLLKRSTTSDLYKENSRNNENYQHNVNKVLMKENYSPRIKKDEKCNQRTFNLPDKHFETAETKLTEAVSVLYPPNVNRDIQPRSISDSSFALTSKHLPLSTTNGSKEIKTRNLTFDQAVIHKTIVPDTCVNETKDDISSSNTTTSMDIADQRPRIISTLPSIGNLTPPKSKTKFPIHCKNSEYDSTTIVKETEKSSTPDLSSPFLVSPLKPRPPVPPKPQTPRRLNQRTINRTIEAKQNESLITSPNALKPENFPTCSSDQQFTRVEPNIPTILPKPLPSIQSSAVYQTVGPSEIPTLSCVSMYSPTDTGKNSSVNTYLNKGTHSVNTNDVDANIKEVFIEDDSKTKKMKHVNFRSPVLCEYVLRSPSSDEPSLPSPPESLLDYCGTGDVKQEDNITDSPYKDFPQSKYSITSDLDKSDIVDTCQDIKDIQTSLNQNKELKPCKNNNFGKWERLSSSEHFCSQNVELQCVQRPLDSDGQLQSSTQIADTERMESSFEAKHHQTLLTKELPHQNDELSRQPTGNIHNASELLANVVCEIDSSEKSTPYDVDGLDGLDLRNVKDILAMEETNRECGAHNQCFQGNSSINVEAFNPNSSSTPLQSTTKLESDVSYETNLEITNIDEGEDTFEKVQEALSKRRERFINESFDSS